MQDTRESILNANQLHPVMVNGGFTDAPNGSVNPRGILFRCKNSDFHIIYFRCKNQVSSHKTRINKPLIAWKTNITLILHDILHKGNKKRIKNECLGKLIYNLCSKAQV